MTTAPVRDTGTVKDEENYPESQCLACRTHITLLGGMWTEDDGGTACYDTSAPYVPHKPKEAGQ